MSAKRDAAAEAAKLEYVLRLSVTGITPVSRRAIININAICQEYLQGRYELQVVDIYPKEGIWVRRAPET